LTICTEELYSNLERALVYPARTKKIGTTFSAHTDGAKKLRAYADANWTTTRSTTGFVIMLAGGALTHASRRQHCISMSTCEAEVIALADCAIELLYIIGLLRLLGHEIDEAIEVYTDNKAAYDEGPSTPTGGGGLMIGAPGSGSRQTPLLNRVVLVFVLVKKKGESFFFLQKKKKKKTISVGSRVCGRRGSRLSYKLAAQ